MIRITMKRYDRTVELKLPTEYEHVLVSLWKLGLDRDPSKYTLRELNAVISYDTPDEHQMTRIITIRNTLMDALVLLHRMMAPPFPIAARVRSRVLEGSYRSGIALLTDIDELVENEAMYEVEMYFPVSGELVDAKGNIEKAPPEIMIEYERMINSALSRVVFQSLHNETRLFSDVDGLYQKLLSAKWHILQHEGRLVGKVVFLLTDELTEDEAMDAAEKIEMVNSIDFAIRLKQWSVLTDRGLLFPYLCDKTGDYAVIPPDALDDEEDDDAPCLCPDCQEKIRKQAGTAGAVLSTDELEDCEDEC